MNVRSGRGAVHHLVDETQRLLCGHTEPLLEVKATGDAATCPACVRMLADDVRRDGQTSHDSED